MPRPCHLLWHDPLQQVFVSLGPAMDNRFTVYMHWVGGAETPQGVAFMIGQAVMGGL
jgi:hypothetical protein